MALTSNNVKYGDWQKERLLGSGGFGQVSLWVNIKTRERIAVKMCKLQLQEKQFKRWQQEVKIMQEIQHDSIVSFREVPKDIQKHYVVSYVALGMEYCELGDLRRMLGQPRNCCGLPEFQVRDFLKNIGSAIHFLHNKGIIHRDIKPENIVMKSLGQDRIQFKIIDLGYAKDLNDSSVVTSFVGTIHYLAPEFSTTQPLRYSETVDFWSFGLVAFECITGRRPFYPHFDNAIQFLSTLREKKRDEDICTTEDEGPDPPFLSCIPQPNALNSVLAKKLGKWLQKMLLFDAGLRGGGDGPEGWNAQLQDILSEKHVLVCNPHKNKILAVPVEPGLSIWTFKDRLSRLTNIPVNDQMLLFADGQVPDVRKSVLDQCWKEPSNEDWKLYLFSHNVEASLPEITLPKTMDRLSDSTLVNAAGSRVIRRLLCLATNFVNTQCRRCQQLLAALYALKNSVERRYAFFNTCINDLRRSYFTMLGQLELCDRSLRQDMEKFEELDQALDMSEYEYYINNWGLEQEKLAQIREVDSVSTEAVLKSEQNFSNTQYLLKKADHFVSKTTPRLNEIVKICYQQYEDIRMKIRQMHENERRLRPAKETQPVNDNQEDLQNSLKDLVLKFVRPTVKEVTKYSRDCLHQIPELVKITLELPKHVMECTEEKRKLDTLIQTMQDDQQLRQTSLWEMISHGKGSVQMFHNLIADAYQVTVVDDSASNNLENMPSIKLAEETNQQLHKFNLLAKDVVSKNGLGDLLDLDWTHLHDTTFSVPGTENPAIPEAGASDPTFKEAISQSKNLDPSSSSSETSTVCNGTMASDVAVKDEEAVAE